MPHWFVLWFLFGLCFPPDQGEIHSVVFYNVENLFDPTDDPNHFDEEYTPTGRKQWTPFLMEQKINQLARVLAKVGYTETKQLPLFIGLAEVENYNLLAQISDHPQLQKGGYRIAHSESKDPRGIDVGLLYKPSVFDLKDIKKYPLSWENETTRTRYFSRDILVVGGFLQQHKINILINHWPSRRGGVKKSKPLRLLAAKLHHRIVDSLVRKDPNTFIISMGDYNDNPKDNSIKYLTSKGFTNPMQDLYTQGKGSLAFRDRWFLFDQMLFSQQWFTSNQLFWIASKIYRSSELYTPNGRYKNYPYRTRIKGNHLEGFSDHFPIYSLIGLRY